MKKLPTFWLLFISTTSAYLLISIFIFSGGSSFLGYIGGFIGLFVPFGLFSIYLLSNPTAWLSIPVFFIPAIFFSTWLEKQNFETDKKVFLSLLVLMILTLLTDFARQTPLMSLKIFINGGLNLGI